jgi:hypothetical protein
MPRRGSRGCCRGEIRRAAREGVEALARGWRPGAASALALFLTSGPPELDALPLRAVPGDMCASRPADSFCMPEPSHCAVGLYEGAAAVGWRAAAWTRWAATLQRWAATLQGRAASWTRGRATLQGWAASWTRARATLQGWAASWTRGGPRCKGGLRRCEGRLRRGQGGGRRCKGGLRRCKDGLRRCKGGWRRGRGRGRRCKGGLRRCKGGWRRGRGEGEGAAGAEGDVVPLLGSLVRSTGRRNLTPRASPGSAAVLPRPPSPGG